MVLWPQMPRPDPNGSFLVRLSALCGREVVDKIVAAYGGREMFIPSRCKPGSKLVDLVGPEVARNISREFLPGKQLVPLGYSATSFKRLDRIRELRRQGLRMLQ